MKKISFLLALVMPGAMLWAQQGALVEYTMNSSMGGSGTVKGYYSDLGSRTEVNMTMGQMGTINKVSITQKDKPGIVIALDDQAKTYTETEIKDQPASNDEATVKVIGNEKIGKYNCIHSQVTQKNNTTDFWTTKDIDEYSKYASPNKNSKFFGNSKTQDALKKANADGFIVKVVSKDRGMDMTIELTKFEKQAIAADKFSVPAGYTKANTQAAPGPGMDASKLKDMTPEERQKYIESVKKQYGGGGN